MTDNADAAGNMDSVNAAALDEMWAHFYNAQLNGQAIPGLGGVGGELIQAEPQEQVPVTSFLPDGIKKEEDVKEEDHLATVVTVYVPPPTPPPAEPIVLSIGEIHPGYETKADREELLDRTVRKLSVNNQPMRLDLLTPLAKDFIGGKIDGLFDTYVQPLSTILYFTNLFQFLSLFLLYRHLLRAAHDEVRNVNKRSGRRRRRKRKSMKQNHYRNNPGTPSSGSSSSHK